jgi:hypothetical protein
MSRVIGLTLLLSSRHAQDSDPAQGDAAADLNEAVPSVVSAYASKWGVTFSIRRSFAEDVTLARPTLRAGDLRARASLWPQDDSDHEGEDLDPLELPEGTRVLIEGHVRPPCDGRKSAQDVVFAVHLRTAKGNVETRRFSAQRPDLLATATKKWCSFGPSASVGPTLIRPNGDTTVVALVTNPGPRSLRAELPAYSNGRTSWSSASAEVPPGRTVKLTVHGTHVLCKPEDRASWKSGRLRIDGRPYAATSDEALC